MLSPEKHANLSRGLARVGPIPLPIGRICQWAADWGYCRVSGLSSASGPYEQKENAQEFLLAGHIRNIEELGLPNLMRL
jgi:hypothetical protein